MVWNLRPIRRPRTSAGRSELSSLLPCCCRPYRRLVRSDFTVKTTWKVNVNYTLLIREISLFCGISVGGVSSYSAESELYVHGRIASHRIASVGYSPSLRARISRVPFVYSWTLCGLLVVADTTCTIKVHDKIVRTRGTRVCIRSARHFTALDLGTMGQGGVPTISLTKQAPRYGPVHR